MARDVDCICAIDQGTQSTRVYLLDRQAEVVGGSQTDFTQFYPRSGWTEHDPEEILESVKSCIDGALKDAASNGYKAHVKGIGITNQRETTVVWDRQSGNPLHKAIVWHDGRTSHLCEAMRREFGSADYFRDITGLPISPYFSAYKFKWLTENVKEVAAALDSNVCSFGTVDTWLIWKLTGGPQGGVMVTDVSNASRTNLMELKTQTWHKKTCQLFGIKEDMLAEIKSNSEVYGYVKEGPLKGVPISGCIGDQQASLLGQSCQQGEAKNTYGTGCFLLLNTGTECVASTHGLLSTIAYQLGPKASVQYALEGSIAVGGLGVRWLRDNLGAIDSAAASQELAASVPDTAGLYFVPAFSGLLAPHWREDARGVLVGLTMYSQKAHIVRAMLEAIAWQTKEVLEAMKTDTQGKEVDCLRADGGASNNDLLMQIQADVLQIEVQRPSMLETTSLGAAYAAGLGVEFWSQEEVLRGLRSKTDHQQVFQPEECSETVSKRYRKWQKAVQLSFGLADLCPE